MCENNLTLTFLSEYNFTLTYYKNLPPPTLPLPKLGTGLLPWLCLGSATPTIPSIAWAGLEGCSLFLVAGPTSALSTPYLHGCESLDGWALDEGAFDGRSGQAASGTV